jgi:ferredoxin-NADP reductase
MQLRSQDHRGLNFVSVRYPHVFWSFSAQFGHLTTYIYVQKACYNHFKRTSQLMLRFKVKKVSRRYQTDAKSSFTAPRSLLSSKLLSRSDTCSPNIKTFILKKPTPFEYHAGQAIDLFVPSADGGVHPEKATFSLISAPVHSSEGTMEIAVKSTNYYPIRWLLDKAKIGETIFLDETPKGSMFLPVLHAPSDPLLLIGAGIGITPILSIVEYLKSIPNELAHPRKVDIIHQAKSPSEFLLWSRLTDFVKQTPNVGLSYIISEEPSIETMAHLDPLLRPHTKFGSIEESDFTSLNLTSLHHVILCGPPGFVFSTKQMLLRLAAIPEHRIHVDQKT